MVDKEKCRTGDHFDISMFRGTKRDRRPVGAVTVVEGISLAVKGWTSSRWSRRTKSTRRRVDPLASFRFEGTSVSCFFGFRWTFPLGSFSRWANPSSRKSIGKGKVNLPITQEPWEVETPFSNFRICAAHDPPKVKLQFYQIYHRCCYDCYGVHNC